MTSLEKGGSLEGRIKKSFFINTKVSDGFRHCVGWRVGVNGGKGTWAQDSQASTERLEAGEGVEVAGLRTRGAAQMLGEEQEVPANLE